MYLIPRKFAWIFVIAGLAVSVLWARHDISRYSPEERLEMDRKVKELGL